MNAERIRALADYLEDLPPEGPTFDMNAWFRNSSGVITNYASVARSQWQHGTAACLAGHVVVLFDDGDDGNSDWIPLVAEHKLGLSSKQGWELFAPTRIDRSRANAISTLRHLADTGEVQWPN
jgi:hypothetical protein